MSILEIVKMQERRDGKIEGRHEEALEIVTKLKAKNMIFDEITEFLAPPPDINLKMNISLFRQAENFILS